MLKKIISASRLQDVKLKERRKKMKENMKKIIYDIGVDAPISPNEMLPEVPAEISAGTIVVLTGRAPIWRYCQAFHKVHGLACAIATHDPRLGDVVVASHTPGLKEGDII